MTVDGHENVNGKLISGLRSEKWVKKYWYLNRWSVEKKLVEDTLNILHSKMAKFHKTVVKNMF